MTPLLSIISPELSQLLSKCGKVRTFGENQEIFAGGDDASFLPIVLSGRVKMIHFLEPGKEVIIGVFQDGEMFAVPPVFDGGKYPATAIAMDDARLMLVARKDFLEVLRSSSEFSFAVIQWMCGMLREKTATIQNLATASPEHRVASILLKLALKESHEAPVKITHRRQDIARMAGLTTETTIRTIRKLADKDLVTISHGKVVVESPQPLQEFLEA
ncbi:MAG: Crp/Fnr family transcriptional regulator [Pyrinomonadaceae bacterium]